MEDFNAILQIGSQLTLTGFMFFAWLKEREERMESQKLHREDLREIAGIKHPLQRQFDNNSENG